MRKLAVLALVAALSAPAAPAKKPVQRVAPEALPPSIALFLGSLCNGGSRPVTFKARAFGTRFFFEEPSGVTVYRFVDGEYVKEAFLSGSKLGSAMKRYASR